MIRIRARPFHFSPAGLFNFSRRSYAQEASTPNLSSFTSPKYDATRIAEMKQARTRNERTGRVSKAYSKRRKIEYDSAWKEGSNEEILAFEVEELLKRPMPARPSPDQTASNGKATDDASGDFHHVELEIEELSSTGDGLARSASGDHVYAVPFSVRGDLVLANVRKHPSMRSSSGDFIKVVRPSARREGVSPACKYFSVCSGCQFQMLPYQEQLAHKKTIVEKAFRYFSDLTPQHIPAVEDTGPSPLQYDYRTKLTPHFDGPGRGTKGFSSVPPIGFTKKGFKKVMDIESCPISTPIVQEGLKLERAKVAVNISKYKNGATLLLRETTKRIPNESSKDSDSPATVSYSHTADLPALARTTTSTLTQTPSGPQYTYTYPTLPYHDLKTYTSDNNALSTEYISSSSLQFTTRAGSFFQNNNSILPSFLTYLRHVALPPSPKQPLHYLLDAYCGSGLLSISLAPLFLSVLGIEIDGASVSLASTNALLNKIDNTGFIEADAADLFADVPFPPEQTVLVIDPPRKGCSVGFLKQMLKWGPKRVVYVSCNVHSQARDVGWICRGGEGLDRVEKGEGWKGGWRYEIESLKGWDFFPQTGHVEGLCVLNRTEKDGLNKAAEPGRASEAPKGATEAFKASKREDSRRTEAKPLTKTDEGSIWDAVKDEVEAKTGS